MSACDGSPKQSRPAAVATRLPADSAQCVVGVWMGPQATMAQWCGMRREAVRLMNDEGVAYRSLAARQETAEQQRRRRRLISY